jgi:hypothetical protein
VVGGVVVLVLLILVLVLHRQRKTSNKSDSGVDAVAMDTLAKTDMTQLIGLASSTKEDGTSQTFLVNGHDGGGGRTHAEAWPSPLPRILHRMCCPRM